jgi:signal transduction histidine kinase/ActR/RegA family two-component response regulator
MRLGLIVLGPLVVATAVVAYWRSLPYAVRAGVLSGGFLYATTVSYLIGGFHGNMSLLGAACIVLTGLFFGRKVMLVVLGAIALVPVVSAFAMIGGVLPLPDPQLTALTSPRAWARATCVAIVLWSTLGLAVTYVVSYIENALRTERAALLDLRAEQERRERAEQRRHEAELVAAQAQKRELVGQLAAGVAHDFNNVLSVVQCWAGVALGDKATDRERVEGREAILAASRQGAALAQQLLAFCRRNVRTVGAIEVRTAVDSVINVIRRALPDDIEISVEHRDRPVVRADEIELQQIVLNLVVNARDAMPGGGRLRVCTAVETTDSHRQVAGGTLPPGRWATITVEDTGTGIDPAIQERVFEAFFTTKAVGVGTGLGLATVLAIAKEGGGAVGLESRTGVGTRMTAYLPIDGAVAASVAQTVTTTVASARAARILLVEDSASIRALMLSILERAGHTVVQAADGQGAMQAIGSQPFDLLCTDGVMPGDSVRSVIDAFEKRHPEGQVLIVSGHVDEELTRRGIERGRYRLLNKPFLPEALCAAVHEQLARDGWPRLEV